MSNHQQIQLFQSFPHDCAYLEQRRSRNLVVDPNYPMDPQVYAFLLERGFRRSANLVYRPDCEHCDACKSTRLAVARFKPGRSQKRAWKKVEKSLEIVEKPAVYNEQHYRLYQHYTASRHAESDMAESPPEDYMRFLNSAWSDTRFIEIHHDQSLLAVAITDQQPDSLSAVYTFYDPAKMHLSPGIVAIMSQIRLAREKHLQWLYLGFWIAESRKMAYKVRFKPVQVLDRDIWQAHN